MNEAFVSAVMPVRNGATTVDVALDGLLAESDTAREVVVVDDGSVDATWALVCARAARDPRVRPVRGDGKGLVSALRHGVSAASGGLLLRMDADDIALPTRLARQRAHMLTHPDVAALGCRVEAFADDGPVGEGLALYVAWQNGLITPAEHARERFVESPLCHPSVMLRRTAYERVGGYRDFGGPEDYDLFLRLAEGGGALAKLPDTLLRWRHHGSRSTFADPRYALARFRDTKAPHLAHALVGLGKTRFVIWGGGQTGRSLARALEPHGLRASLFIDIDPRKLGRVARGAPICESSALDVTRDALAVAVGARGARPLIRAELDARGFREGIDYFFAA